MLLSLTIIAVVAAAALAFVSYVTAEPIAQAQKAKKEAAVKAVLPAFDKLEEKVRTYHVEAIYLLVLYAARATSSA